jgi:hypothetical protein
MTNNEGMHAKSKSKVRRRYPALQLMRIESECLKMSTPFGRRRRTGNILDRVSAAQVDNSSGPGRLRSGYWATALRDEWSVISQAHRSAPTFPSRSYRAIGTVRDCNRLSRRSPRGSPNYSVALRSPKSAMPPPQTSTPMDRLSALAWTRRRVSGMRFNSWRQGMAMNVDDFRPSIDAASSEVGRRSDAATEGSAFAAAVVPSRKIPPTYANQCLSPDRLRQIDRVFYGPFFREKYGMGGDKALENGRIRYYGPVHPGSPRAENHLSPGSCGRRLIESPFESGHKEIRNAATSVAES